MPNIALTETMMPDRYAAYITHMCTSPILSAYKDTLLSFCQLTMDQRSAIAKLCRARCYPPRTSRLDKMTSALDRSLKNKILPLCQNAVTSGFVLHAILLAPMTRRDIEAIYTESMEKEVLTMVSVKRECTIDFGVYFGRYNDAINEDVQPNPKFAKYVNDIIDTWIHSLQSYIHYPKLGSKTVSKTTSNHIRDFDPQYEPIEEQGITPTDLEYIYHTTGFKVGGSCEMRQKWYCSNLKPRTYYTQGGNAYHSSKYIAVMFADLCDLLPSTNRRSRVDPSRIYIQEVTQDVAYYDLTSFTSNLHVQSQFMTLLSKYCEGKTIVLLDSVDGLVTYDLGVLLQNYTEQNLVNPMYTLPRKYGDDSREHVHNIAGFLGVYGNIATATFIHGIVMGMLHDSLDENNVAGDDGLDVTRDVNYTLSVVGLMGEVHDEKTFRESEGSCIHLKRPINRIGRRLLHRPLVTWPSLEPGEELCDPRYPYLRRKTKRDRKDTMASSVTAFMRKLDGLQLDNDDITLIDTFLTMVYDTYNLPVSGHVPQITGGIGGFVPAYEKRFIGIDPIYNTLSRHYTSIVKLPLRGYEVLTYEKIQNMTFSCNSNSLLRHLEALGYLRQEKVSIVHFGEQGMQQLLKEFMDPEPCIYQYTIVQKLPDWTVDVIA